jgi:hypothetical protein
VGTCCFSRVSVGVWRADTLTHATPDLLPESLASVAAQHPFQPTRRNQANFAMQKRHNVIPIYQRHPAGG